MPLLSSSTSLFIGKIEGRVPDEYSHQTATPYSLESCVFVAFSEKTRHLGGVSARVLGSGFISSVHVEIYPKDFSFEI